VEGLYAVLRAYHLKKDSHPFIEILLALFIVP
jgi:hypothetical protein